MQRAGATALVLAVAGCMGGQVPDNGLVTVENRTPARATMHWTSTGVHAGEGDDPIGPCGSEARGFGPGHVAITLTAGSGSRTVEFDAPNTGQTAVDLVIGPTGEITVADHQRSRPPCTPT